MNNLDYYHDKKILITGGCGSVGSAILNELIKFNPKRVSILDNNESALFYLQQKFNSYNNIRYLVGDVREKQRLRDALDGIDIVFHAAALKHVPLCEYNPDEAVKTNIFGTLNLIEVAREYNTPKVISISTDKAVNPINTMGATKLISEKLILRGNRGSNTTKFSCVRFGNVLNSNGSVIPLFKEQIKSGGPVTITSDKMTRFFMSMPQAANLVLEAGRISEGYEIFILKMNALKIIDLAEVLIEEICSQQKIPKNNISIKSIGLRPGEKLYEALFTSEEIQNILETDKMYIIKENEIDPSFHQNGVSPQNTIKSYSSADTKLLSKEEIKQILKEQKII